MSDIGILNSPFEIALIALLLGSPGLVIGAVAGALAWRSQRIWGAVGGAAAGWGLWLLGWLRFTGNL